MTDDSSPAEMPDWYAVAGACREAIAKARPLVHHVTNEVSAQLSANAVLALGGGAVMARDPGEVDGVVDQSDAVVLNLGTLTGERQRALERAHRSAIRYGKPIVLDPVGAGSVGTRDRLARRLLRGPSWMAVRMNAAELSGIMRIPLVAGRGVDADGDGEEADVDPVAALARRLAEQAEVVVAVTGETDIITDGRHVVYVEGGHPWLTRITGAGCMASSVVGAALGAYHDRTRLFSIVEATVAGLALCKAAAAWAAEACGADGGAAAEAEARGKRLQRPLPPGPGTFGALLVDGLFHVDGDEVKRRVTFREASV